MKGKVLEIYGKLDGVNKHCAFAVKMKGSENYHQMWRIVYKDEDDLIDYKKGDFVK
jgi:hypothetical protein